MPLDWRIQKYVVCFGRSRVRTDRSSLGGHLGVYMGARRKENEVRSEKASAKKCCVKTCKNSYVNMAGKLPEIRFYSFPAKPYEEAKRRLWINAVRRAR